MDASRHGADASHHSGGSSRRGDAYDSSHNGSSHNGRTAGGTAGGGGLAAAAFAPSPSPAASPASTTGGYVMRTELTMGLHDGYGPASAAASGGYVMRTELTMGLLSVDGADAVAAAGAVARHDTNANLALGDGMAGNIVPFPAHGGDGASAAVADTRTRGSNLYRAMAATVQG